jgi:hypothetical protein
MGSLARGDGAGALEVSSVRLLVNYRCAHRLGLGVIAHLQCRSLRIRLAEPVQGPRSRWQLMICVSNVNGNEV